MRLVSAGRAPAWHPCHNGSSGTFLPVKGFITMATVTFDKATRVYPGSTIPAVDKLDLVIEDGEFLVLVGPSGCGKSTSLRMLAGLEDVDEGNIFIGERDVTTLPPKDRDIAMVFQNYALYPHMSVAENMGFALKIAGVPKDEIITRVKEAAGILDLEPYLERKPKALSGGQRQRVAMGRALHDFRDVSVPFLAETIAGNAAVGGPGEVEPPAPRGELCRAADNCGAAGRDWGGRRQHLGDGVEAAPLRRV